MGVKKRPSYYENPDKSWYARQQKIKQEKAEEKKPWDEDTEDE